MDLAEWALMLQRAAAEVVAESAAVVGKGLHNIKTEAVNNAKASSGTHAAKYPDTITYSPDDGGLSGEVGPEKRGQGNLGPILENGSVHNPPHRDLGRALDNEEPKFLAEVSKIGKKWL